MRAASAAIATVNQVGLDTGLRAAQFGVRLLQRRNEQHGLEAQLEEEALLIGSGQLDLIDLLERTATAPRMDDPMEGMDPLPDDDAIGLLPTVRKPHCQPAAFHFKSVHGRHERAPRESGCVLTRVCALATDMPEFDGFDPCADALRYCWHQAVAVATEAAS